MSEQKLALSAAIALGEAISFGVTIPHAVFRGKRVPFCLLFDANTLPTHGRMTSLILKAAMRDLCAAGGVDAAALARDANGRGVGDARCLDFRSLLRLAAEGGFDAAAQAHMARMRVCDPKDHLVGTNHACFREAYKQLP